MNRAAVEDVYRLLPLQEGMLFETLRRPGSGAYVLQVACRLEGSLNPEALERAWRETVARHPVLRTSFHWEGLDRPHQVVHRDVALPLAREDWRDVGRLGPEAEEDRLRELLTAERRRGFDLQRAPLLRLTLLELGGGRWRLVWSQHHLVVDGWSQPLILREVFERYRAAVAGEEPALPPAAPFRRAVERRLAGDRRTDEAFWRQELAGLDGPTPLALPGPAAPARRPGREGPARHVRVVSAGVTAALDAFARRAGLTASALVHGAWALALTRWTDAAPGSDVLVGVVVSGRPADLPGVESTVGPFINTLPLRVEVPAAGSGEVLGPWLRRLRRRLAAAEEHGSVSLVEIHGWSVVPRDRPLFEALVAFENYPVDRALGAALAEGAAGVRVSDVRSVEQDGMPLSLAALPGERLELALTFDPERFDGAAVRRLLAQTATLLEAMAAADEATPLAELPRLPRPEEHRLLRELPPGIPPGSGGAAAPSVLGAFRSRVADAPEAPALHREGQGTWITYGALGLAVERLGAALHSMGAGPEVPVAVLPESPAEAVTAFLGALAAGAVYSPLDPALPAERAARLLDRILARDGRDDPGGGAPRLLVCRRERAGRLRLPPGTRVLDPAGREGPGTAEGPGQAPPPPEPPPTVAAYLIHTSGSTGEPQGVVVSRGALAEHLAVARHAYGLGPGDRVLQVQSPAFDASVEQLLGALTAGACLFPREGPVWSPGELLDRLDRWRITVANLPTAYWRELVRSSGPVGGSRGGALRLLLVGGEAMAAEAARRRAEAGGTTGAATLLNAYGPTEAVVTATLERVAADVEGGTVPIGRPLPGRRALVLDADGRTAPDGAPGELCLGGVLARGYAGRPSLTASRFVPDPCPGPCGPAGARVYRTGDRARWLPDGRLQFLGRLDDQVKVRGFRVEPGEVEALLAGLPEVADAAVVAIPGPDGADLAAWVVPAGGDVTARDLRSELGAKAPGYLVPAVVSLMDALPRTATGKVDRRALRDRAARERPARIVREGPAPAGSAPRTQLESEVAAVWAEVLGLEEIGREDRFFDLGGHSLRALQVVSRLREALGVEVPLEAVFRRSTVAELAREVEALLGTAPQEAPPPLRRVPRDGPLPPSAGQERLWFLQQLDPSSAAYNLPLAVRLRGPLDTTALESALAGLVRRHESLRTTLSAVSGRPLQVIAPAAPAAGPLLPRVDLAALPRRRRRAEAERITARESRRPFDLARGPLLRTRLVAVDGDPAEHLLVLVLHHVVSDEWSLAVLVDELAAGYRGDHPARPPLQYADWAAWQREWMDSPSFERRLAWWRDRLAGAPEVVDLPADRPRPATPTNRGGRVPLVVSEPVAERLRRFARDQGSTLFAVLLAGVHAWLRRHGAGDDLVVGTPVANRTHREAEGLIGFFVNTVAVRTTAPEDPPFADLVRFVQQDALAAIAHQDVPFERVVETTAPDRAAARDPLVQVMLALHTVAMPALDLPGGPSLEPVPVPAGGAKLDLLLELTDGAASGALAGEPPARDVAGALEYAADLFDRSSAVRLARHLVRILEGAAADPGRRLSELSLLSPAERFQLTVEWSGPDRRFAGAEALPDRLAARAAERPDAVAVVAAGAAVTYGELLRRSDDLAARLRAVGVGLESPVGLLSDRSVDLVVGVVGILRAGAAYVPLDPRHPLERLAYVLDDADAAVVVTGSAPEGGLPAMPGRTCLPALGPRTPEGPRVPAAPPPEALAYVIYTSGSTGRPKGTLVNHGNVTRLFRAAEATFHPGPDDTWSLFHSPAFDFSVWELWGALAHGGRLEVVPYWAGRSAESFLGLLAERRVTVASQTPSAFRALEVVRRRTGSQVPAALRWLVFGGERLDPATLADWLGRDLRVANLYGITETTVHVTLREIGPRDLAAPWRSPLGRPLPDLATYVLDRPGRPAAAGVPGEIVVGGPGLARGYLGRPGLTAERFVPDPFSGAPGSRLYRSGDLGRWLPLAERGAELESLGRIDQQLKVRGFRVEPGEVESALASLPGVDRAVVVGRGDLPGGPGLLAYVVPWDPAQPPGEDALRAALRKLLPEPMVPAHFMLLDDLPLSATGKVDRRALPAPVAASRRGRPYAPPRTALEQVLAGAWAEALEVERVGLADSFFDLGGHSLLATQVVSWVRETFEVEVPLRELFARPTVAELAALLTREPGVAERVERTAELLLELAEVSDEELAGRQEDRHA